MRPCFQAKNTGTRSRVFEIARPLKKEALALASLPEEPTLSSLEEFSRASSTCRSIFDNPPKIAVCGWMRNGDGLIGPSAIQISSLSWVIFLHEWCHWIVGCSCRRPPNEADEDAACEAYAQSLVWSTRDDKAAKSMPGVVAFRAPKEGQTWSEEKISALASAYLFSITPRQKGAENGS